MNSLKPLLLVALLAAAPLAAVADQQRAQAPGPAPARAPIELNTADRKTLEAAPAIGPQLAPLILAARPFASLDDLDRVRGIPAEQLEQIRAVAVVRPAPEKQKLGEPTREKQRLGSPDTVQPASRDRTPAKPDLNTASEAALAAVSVIGPDLARKIVAARPFASLDELSRIPGLTAEQLEQVRAALTLGRTR